MNYDNIVNIIFKNKKYRTNNMFIYCDKFSKINVFIFFFAQLNISYA